MIDWGKLETAEDKAAKAEAAAHVAWKAARSARVAAIKVTTAAGRVFDGDELSQTRMARAISAMDDADTTLWVLADNTPAQITRSELKEALRLAGEAQSAIWVKS